MKDLSRKGFTLVELMIVISIITVLAAIAIPNLLRARISANESAAISNLRTIDTACEVYRTAQTPMQYPPSLVTLGTTNPPYIDNVLASGRRQGYNYTYTQGGGGNTFTCRATPQIPNITGVRIFFVDESGVIRLNNAAGAPVE